jgi:putative endonuclease
VPRNRVPTQEAAEEYYVYLACCANGAFYVGYTRNVERRIAVHNAGHGGRYTRSHRPLTLVAAWPYGSRVEALRAERKLKSLPHERKRKLAEAPYPLIGASE